MHIWSSIRREPFRLLFPIGTLFGLLGVGHWLSYALGWSSSYSGFYHASIQMSSYMYCFIAGFLMTAVPRFSASFHATGAELIAIFSLLAAQGVFLSMDRWVPAQICFALLLLTLAVFAIRRFSARRVPQVQPPMEFVWIPTGILMGLVGTVLAGFGRRELAPRWFLAAGVPMVQQGFVLSIVLGVGGFMAPRLMGHPVSIVGKDRSDIGRFHLLAGAVLFLSFLVEGAGAVAAAYLIRAAVVTVEFVAIARFHLPPRTDAQYLHLLRLSLWMMAAGLWSAGFFPGYRVAMLHLVFLGGFSLMVFAVATMVVLSHSAEAAALTRPLWIFRVIAWGIGGALAARVAADFMPGFFFPLVGAASALWMVVAVCWLGFVLPRLVKQADPREIEQIHEQARKRLHVKGEEP